MVKQKTVTEETYNLIINLYGEGNNYISELNRYSDASNYFDGVRFETIVSILNPLTRDWAHDQFVEKEKKYYWVSKNTDADGNYVHICSDRIGRPSTFYSEQRRPVWFPFTESEVKSACFNIDMFDREEVSDERN